MRVAVAYATDFGNISAGGIQSFIRSVGRAAPDDFAVEYWGIGDQAAALPRESDIFFPLGRVTSRGSVNLQYARRLRKFLSTTEAPDLVLLHRAEHAVFVPKQRSLLMLHGGTYYAWRASHSLFGALYPLIEVLAVAKATRAVSVVPGRHGVLTRHLAQFPAFTSCYDDDLFFPGSGPILPRVLFAGRLVREKRAHLIIDAAAELGFEITIAGDGPERPNLADRARRQGVKAEFLGPLSQAELAELYRVRPGVFAMASQFEGFPVSLLEAAASGLPVAATPAPGLAEATRAVGGVLSDTQTSLSAAILRARDSTNSVSPDEIRHRFGARAVGAAYWSLARSVVASGAQ